MIRTILIVAMLCATSQAHWIPGDTEDAKGHNTLDNHDSWNQCCPAPPARMMDIPQHEDATAAIRRELEEAKRAKTVKIFAIAVIVSLLAGWAVLFLPANPRTPYSRWRQ